MEQPNPSNPSNPEILKSLLDSFSLPATHLPDLSLVTCHFLFTVHYSLTGERRYGLLQCFNRDGIHAIEVSQWTALFPMQATGLALQIH